MSNADHARHLALIVRELKELNINPQLVHLSADGVTLTDLTLTDELFLIAMQLDAHAALNPAEPRQEATE